jgi:integrase
VRNNPNKRVVTFKRPPVIEGWRVIFSATESTMALSEADIMALIHRIETSRHPKLDPKVLTTVVKLAYLTGLKKSEIISLRIGDVMDAQGNIFNEIPACEKTIERRRVKLLLSDPVKQILRDHRRHLKKYQYSLARNAPLFPQKDKSPYSESTLGRHLKKFYPPGDCRLEKIRQAGMHRVLRELTSKGITDTDIRLARAAEYARTTKKNIDRLIYGRERRQDMDNLITDDE